MKPYVAVSPRGRSTVINIRGDSYRLKEKRQAKCSNPDIEVLQAM